MNTKTDKRQNQHCRLNRHSLNSFFGAFLSVFLLMTLLCLTHCKNDKKSPSSDGSESPSPGPTPTPGPGPTPDPDPICSLPVEASGFNKGEGTVGSPFLICSRSQLEEISMGLGKHYELGQSIDLQNDPFTPLLGSFTGSLDGKGYEIQNLTIAVSTKQAGLFAELGAAGSIQNLGIVGLNVTSTNTGGTGSDPVRIGALAALMSGGEIKNCYAIANDSDDDPDLRGGNGQYDYVGGLVGQQDGGSIIGSYANGNAYGGNGSFGRVGGLVGRQDAGSIIGSYATGNADGGEDNDAVGGLVGWQQGGSIIGSYANGDADGGAGGGTDRVGGLLGAQSSGSIIGSYAAGNASGGMGISDLVGGLVGTQGGSHTESYGFGSAYGNASGASDDSGDTVNTLGAHPDSLTSATGLTAGNAGAQWAGAWDFGDSSQTPALMYVTGAMLSGTTVTYECVASKLPAGVSCGDLLAGQGR